MALLTTHVARKIPIGAINEPLLSIIQMNRLKPKEKIMVDKKIGVDLIISPRFQRSVAPTGNRHARKITIGVKPKLKNGAPTEIFFLIMISAIRGQKVPTKITKKPP